MSTRKCSKWANCFKNLLTNARKGCILQAEKLKTSRNERKNAQNIEAERARRGLSKDELSGELGISTRTYYNWVSEETDSPSQCHLDYQRIEKYGGNNMGTTSGSIGASSI